MLGLVRQLLLLAVFLCGFVQVCAGHFGVSSQKIASRGVAENPPDQELFFGPQITADKWLACELKLELASGRPFWLSPDPAGFLDGPNLYAYVRQNPWTMFDPLGLLLASQNEPPAEPCLVCHGNYGTGHTGDVSEFRGLEALPNSGPRAREGYALVKSGSITLATLASPVDETVVAVKIIEKIPGVKQLAQAALRKGSEFLESAFAQYKNSRFASETGAVGDLTPNTPPSNAPGGTPSQLYEVGLAKDLKKTPVPGTQVNHAPGSAPASTLVGGHSPVNKFGHEPSIRLPISEHEAVSAAQRALGAQPSARSLLAEEIRILRNNTQAPNSALQDLIRLNKETHPWDYLKLGGAD